MRVHMVFAHPSETSFLHALNDEVREILLRKGWEVDALDLYAERFDPVMSRRMYADYLDPVANRREVSAYVDRLLAADALVLLYPVWHDGLPAILKGYIDRVFLRGVVFEIDAGGVFRPTLHNVRRLAAIATYGASRARTAHVGDLPPPARHAQFWRADRAGRAGRISRGIRYGRRPARGPRAIPAAGGENRSRMVSAPRFKRRRDARAGAANPTRPAK